MRSLIVVIAAITGSMLSAATGLAQSAGTRAASAVAAYQQKQDGALWEDIDVLSGLVESAVRQLYGSRRGQLRRGVISNSEDGLQGLYGYVLQKPSAKGTGRQFGAPYSTYLGGFGIVLQLELPPLRPAPESGEAEEPAFCTFTSKTAWERERIRLRRGWNEQDCMKCHEGFPTSAYSDNTDSYHHKILASEQGRLYDVTTGEQIKRKNSPQAPTKDQLVAQLLKLLADNGHHIQGLGPDESIAIAVAFRDQSKRLIRPTLSTWGYRPKRLQDRSRSAPGNATTGNVYPDYVGSEGQPSESDALSAPQPEPDNTPEYALGRGYSAVPGESRRETEGDLFLRQGNYRKAIEAYEQALKAFESSGGAVAVVTGEGKVMVRGRSRSRALLRKMSQAQVGAGNLKSARKLLDRLERLESESPESGSDASQKKPSGTLPARLVIRAPKSALDEVAAKKITFEQFQELIGVDFFEPQPVGESSDPDSTSRGGVQRPR